jgi:hypothetical protein
LKVNADDFVRLEDNNMADKERLAFLLSYHHNLTLQLNAAPPSERWSFNSSLGKIEEQIESILFSENAS